METEWMTAGQYFRAQGGNFPMESFKRVVRKMKIPPEPGSRPYRYRREDLDRAFERLKARSLIMKALR